MFYLASCYETQCYPLHWEQEQMFYLASCYETQCCPLHWEQVQDSPESQPNLLHKKQ